MPMIYAKRELRYAGRTVVAGEGFEASDRDAKLLVAVGKAVRECPAAPKTPLPPSRNLTDPPRRHDAGADDAELDALRAEYEAKTGKRPFMGWKAEKLRDRIAAATSPPGTYMRRDLRAED